MDTQMQNKFEKEVLNYVDKTDVLVLAVSGGVDSVVMLYMFHKLGFKNVIVAHVDHNLRVDSVNDGIFIEKLAKKFNYKFVGTVLSIPENGNLENNARELRYEFLADTRVKFDAKYIVTAHHKNDQAETIIMNLLKGTFIKGMGGMNVVCERRKIFRPLLSFKKMDLIKYAQDNGIDFNLDYTNAVNDFDRNFIRNEVFPFIETRFEHAQDKLADSSGFYREMVVYFNEEVDKWLNINSTEYKWGVSVDKSSFICLPEFFKFFVLNKLLDVQLSRSDFVEIVKLVIDSSSGSQRLSGTMNIYVSTDHFLISEFSLDALHGLVFGYKLTTLDTLKHRSIRTFKDGDKFLSKKLKDSSVWKNIPWYMRNGIPLSVDEDDNVIEVFD